MKSFILAATSGGGLASMMCAWTHLARSKLTQLTSHSRKCSSHPSSAPPSSSFFSAASSLSQPRLAAVDPRTTALILVGYQNDFVEHGGKFHKHVEGVMASTRMLGNTVELVAASRRAGVLILHSPILSAPQQPASSFGALAYVKAVGAFKEGSWGAQVCGELSPVEGDVILSGNRGLDAFGGTDLGAFLTRRGIKAVAVGGFVASAWVESTCVADTGACGVTLMVN